MAAASRALGRQVFAVRVHHHLLPRLRHHGTFPILHTAFVSLRDWDQIRGTGTFVGFDQFNWVPHDPNFWKALRNTFSILLLSSLPQVIAATLIAAMRRFISMTVPQIRPTFVFVIIMSTNGGLQIFEEPSIDATVGKGGANKQWLTITLCMYNTGWQDFDFGRAAAVAWLLFPFYWSFLIGSGDSFTLNNPTMSWLPGGNFLDNASYVINSPSVHFWKALGNSMIMSLTVSATTVALSTLAGFAFAKPRFKSSGPLLIGVIATMAVPVQLGVVPLYILMQKYGWTGHLGAVIVPALVTAFGVFWMTQYLSQSLPTEMIEAARVDGCSMIRVFWNVALPAARPAAAMLGLFTFVATGTTSSGHSSCSTTKTRRCPWR